MNWFVWQDTELLLNLSLQPGAKRSEWIGLHGDRLKLRLQAPPVDGRANAQLIDFLGEQFGIAKAQVTIEQGLASRQKRVRIRHPLQIPQPLHELGLQLPRQH